MKKLRLFIFSHNDKSQIISFLYVIFHCLDVECFAFALIPFQWTFNIELVGLSTNHCLFKKITTDKLTIGNVLQVYYYFYAVETACSVGFTLFSTHSGIRFTFHLNEDYFRWNSKSLKPTTWRRAERFVLVRTTNRSLKAILHQHKCRRIRRFPVPSRLFV